MIENIDGLPTASVYRRESENRIFRSSVRALLIFQKYLDILENENII